MLLNDTQFKVAVIGAGPAGLTAAYELAKTGITVEVFEASSSVGGLAKTLTLWNQKVDLGPHRFFSSDPRVNKVWLEIVGQDYKIVERLTRIFYKNRLFLYPLKVVNVLKNLGLLETLACIASYLKEKILPVKQDGSFENWVIHCFGRYLYELFFKTYSEKLWGISGKELCADFAIQRIKNLSLFEALKNALFGGEGNTHKTLVDQFAYPIHGTGMVYERMASYISSHGGKVFCSCPVERVVVENGTVIGLAMADGEIKKYNHVISSMPITLLIACMRGVPEGVKQAAKKLKFRNTILVYLNIQSLNIFPDNWLYIHSSDLRMGRITNFRNWVPQLYGEEKSTIVVLEYWCDDNDVIWNNSDKDLIDLASKELNLTGFIKNSKILDGYVYRIKRCYPVYDIGYKERLKIVEDYLGSIKGLSIIGRYGAFKYNNQDHSILMGILASENIIKNTTHNLWEINSDYEVYQESSKITETGLVTIKN